MQLHSLEKGHSSMSCRYRQIVFLLSCIGKVIVFYYISIGYKYIMVGYNDLRESLTCQAVKYTLLEAVKADQCLPMFLIFCYIF